MTFQLCHNLKFSTWGSCKIYISCGKEFLSHIFCGISFNLVFLSSLSFFLFFSFSNFLIYTCVINWGKSPDNAIYVLFVRAESREIHHTLSALVTKKKYRQEDPPRSRNKVIKSIEGIRLGNSGHWLQKSYSFGKEY